MNVGKVKIYFEAATKREWQSDDPKNVYKDECYNITWSTSRLPSRI